MHFSEILLSNEYYKNQQYEDALKHTFLSLDKIMNLPNAKREMENYSGRSILNRNSY